VPREKRSLLQIPQGTESFYLEDAYRHRKLIDRVTELFYQWGYLPVQTPIVDYYDSFRALLTENADRDIYRLIDRDGELLMLRSDVTLFLAKQMGMILKSEELPVRVYYADTILRHEAADDISQNEFFQTGIELIGRSDLDGELEVLGLLQETLATLGAQDTITHVGTRKLSSGIRARLGEAAERQLLHAVIMRQEDKLSEILADYPTKQRDAYLSVFRYIGDAAGLQSLRTTVVAQNLGDEVTHALLELEHVFAVLSELNLADSFRVDLSEVGNQPYHSGIVFQSYMHNVAHPVASGGRYDGLLARFGLDAPSVGFSCMVRRIEERTKLAAQSAESSGLGTFAEAKGENFAARFRAARKARQQGESIVLCT
jgi:ATP phosphoribosyltransferase regulatory subunit